MKILPICNKIIRRLKNLQGIIKRRRARRILFVMGITVTVGTSFDAFGRLFFVIFNGTSICWVHSRLLLVVDIFKHYRRWPPFIVDNINCFLICCTFFFVSHVYFIHPLVMIQTRCGMWQSSVSRRKNGKLCSPTSK